MNFNEISNSKFMKFKKKFNKIPKLWITYNSSYNSNEIQRMNFYKTALYIAVEKENYEIIKLLLKNKKLDVNIPAILKTTNI